MTRERVLEFVLGFLVGKTFGALVSTFSLFGIYLEDSTLGGFVLDEFINHLLAFNGYHFVLALIGGLILVVWKSDDLFD